MKHEYEKVEYQENPEWLQKWKDGNTGCPIVDAGMRHLKTTGYMPNRLRMVVANFLTKDLLIDWRLGEQHFANCLTDYDPCQNNGGWQWCAATGVDYKPNLRIFNPMIQSEKFDKFCEYIWKWIPELKEASPEHIHHWETCYIYYKHKGLDYPEPLVQHMVQRKKCLALYEKAKETMKEEAHNVSNRENLAPLKRRENVKKRKAKTDKGDSHILKKVRVNEKENSTSKQKLSEWLKLYSEKPKNS